MLLRADGWDAIHVSEAGLDRASDAEILNFARQNGRTCITLDHRCGRFRRSQPRPRPQTPLAIGCSHRLPLRKVPRREGTESQPIRPIPSTRYADSLAAGCYPQISSILPGQEASHCSETEPSEAL